MCTVSKYENIQLELCLRIYMYIFPNRAVYTYVCIYIIYTYIWQLKIYEHQQIVSESCQSHRNTYENYIRDICIFYNYVPPKNDENQLSKSLAILKNVPTIANSFFGLPQKTATSIIIIIESLSCLRGGDPYLHWLINPIDIVFYKRRTNLGAQGFRSGAAP